MTEASLPTTSAAVHDPFAHLTRLEAVDADADTWRLAVPARPACYLLEDAEHRPVMLATVGDLRQALLRRLSAPTEEGGKRVDYRALVRYVRWRDVCSRFEADWAYLCNARRLFADQWRTMTRNWRAWWIAANLEDAHPRFVSRDRPASPTDQCFGPLPDSKIARRCIEALEDVFDLCREHHLLMQAPNATACAYKQMEKCPAPCDGSIAMDAYRQQIRNALGFLAGERQAQADRLTQQISEASAELDFERAGRLKAQLDHVRLFDHESTRSLAPVTAFNFVVLQRGRRKHTVRAFIVTPGRIHFAGEIQKHRQAEQVDYLADLAERCFAHDVAADPAAAEIGLVAWHLFSAKREGVFHPCPARHVDRASLAAAVADIAERREPSADKADA